MKFKTLMYGVLFSILSAGLASLIVLAANHYLLIDGSPSKEKPSFFKRNPNKEITFIELKNIIITLKSTDGRERYVLLELAFPTTSEENKNLTQSALPALRSATVNLLTNADFHEMHNLTIPELRTRLMTAYQHDLEALTLNVPFDNVIVSKIVFQ